MIVSEIFKIKSDKKLTKAYIENFLSEKNIKAVKWAIVDFSENFTKILVSFEKN